MKHRIISIIGTRPEAIKMAPVILELRRRSDRFEQTVVNTAQHREILNQVLHSFAIAPDVDLGLMRHNQDLAEFASRSLSALHHVFAERRPDLVLIQGDTTTGMAAALAAFYQHIAVGHVEAGLRSFDAQNPFPEEVNRRMISMSATSHFVPTERARDNLLRENVPPDSIFITGNTVVDALRLMPVDGEFENETLRGLDFAGRRVLLVTAHRRENHGRPLAALCEALRRIAKQFDDVDVLYALHPNPNVGEPVRAELAGVPRVHPVAPLAYLDLLRVMARCFLVLTDSGGIQEEAPSFRKPVLILRRCTERPELVETGGGVLVGMDADRIAQEASRLLTDPGAYRRMQLDENPFGDGQAAQKIVAILADRLRR